MTFNYINEAKQIALKNTITIPIDKQPLYFLQRVYSAMPAKQILGVLALSKYHTSHWYKSDDLHKGKIDHVLNWCAYNNSKGHSIFWNVASRKHNVLNRTGAKGTYSELELITCLWADIDCAANNTPLTLAYETLLQFKLVPSLIVFSGGGLQALWVLNEAVDVSTESSAREFKDWQVGFLMPQFKAHELAFDKGVVDTTREIRLPGYVNTKKSRNGAIASLIYENI